jgi:ferrous iron transport protein A
MSVPHNLNDWPLKAGAAIATIDWAAISVAEGRRLRELGFDEGVGVTVLHRARLGAGPMAVRVGRMTVALRRQVARAISVEALPSIAAE